MTTMPLEGKMETSPPRRKSEDEKESTGLVNDDTKPDEAKGGMGPYIVSLHLCSTHRHND